MMEQRKDNRQSIGGIAFPESNPRRVGDRYGAFDLLQTRLIRGDGNGEA